MGDKWWSSLARPVFITRLISLLMGVLLGNFVEPLRAEPIVVRLESTIGQTRWIGQISFPQDISEADALLEVSWSPVWMQTFYSRFI